MQILINTLLGTLLITATIIILFGFILLFLHMLDILKNK